MATLKLSKRRVIITIDVINFIQFGKAVLVKQNCKLQFE